MTYPLLVCAAVIAADDQVLLARRREGDHLAGWWEFPGGKVDPGETPAQALARELREEMAIEVRVGDPVTFTYWEYPEKRVLLLFYRCQILRGTPCALECAEVGWFPLEAVADLDLSPADIPALPAVRAVLQSPPEGRSVRSGEDDGRPR